MSSFDLRRLRYFVSVAELGSVTRAATELHIAQPALSYQIRMLEEEIGSELFARGPSGVRLTEAGRHLLEESRALLSSVREMQERLKERSTEPEGFVAIGLAQTIGLVLGSTLLDLAKRKLPKVEIQLREVMSGDIPNLVRSESVEFAISYEIPPGPGISISNVFAEDLYLFGTRKLAGQYLTTPNARVVPFSELVDIPLYLSAKSNVFRDALEKTARKERLKLNVAAQVDSVAMRKDIALSGVGFTVLSGATIRQEMGSQKLFAARIVHPTVRRKISFVSRSGHPLTRASREVVQLIQDSLRMVMKKNHWPGAIPPVGRLIPRA